MGMLIEDINPEGSAKKIAWYLFLQIVQLLWINSYIYTHISFENYHKVKWAEILEAKRRENLISMISARINLPAQAQTFILRAIREEGASNFIMTLILFPLSHTKNHPINNFKLQEVKCRINSTLRSELREILNI